MDRTRRRAAAGRLTLVLVAAALALTTSVAPAMALGAAGGTPKWRITKVFGESYGYPQLSGGTAVNASLAWVVGNTYMTSQALFLAKWDGQDWNQVSGPAKFSDLPPSMSLSDSTVAASASTTWTFPSVYGPSTRTYATRLAGGKWTTYSLPHAYQIGAAAMFSSSDVWAFGFAVPRKPVLGYGPPFVARFDGHKWHTESMPGVPSRVIALSSKNIWAFGPTAATAGDFNQAYIAMHWTGGAWHSMSIPRIRARNGKLAYPDDLAVLPGGSLWVTEEFHCPHPGCEPAQPSGVLLAHWTGKRWIRVLDETAYEAASLVPDSQGGLWITALNVAKGSFAYLRYDHGKLTTMTVPASVSNLSDPIAIPGTNSAWATGDTSSAGQSPGAVLKYGP